ncbi:hypothetical protein [Ferrovum sp.]|uniref:hypothetical protein n=1 Tax=Ferrovum sp. TaxID=2609467 RepID=UPI002621D13A|nr:hypothetical protein [Ferrovum sp.]
MEKRHRLASKREAGRSERLVERGNEICLGVMRLVEVLDRLEMLLEDCGALLNVSQPPVTGKIGLRWWKLRGGEVEREPIVVVWKKGKGGRFYPDVVDIAVVLRRVKRGGGFALGSDVTRDVVRVMVLALKMRGRILGLMGEMGGVGRVVVAGYGEKVDGWCADVGYWRTVMGGRLDGRFGSCD